MKLRIATRGSALARWQAEHVSATLRSATPDLDVELVIVHTTGDRFTAAELSKLGSTGLFTREVDGAVLDGRADAAVHSLKDLPTVAPDGIMIAAIPAREDPRDVWIPAPAHGPTLDEMPRGARVGTSSLRRRALLLERRPDLCVENLRGNLDTRLARVAAGEVDAAILALAGLRRLGRQDVVGETLDPPDWLPAAGQGALAISARADDTDTCTVLAALDDAETRAAVTAERTLLRTLEGGCQVPIGALARVRGERIALDAFVASLDGTNRRRGFIEGSVRHAARLGEDLADALLRDGADAILTAARAAVAEDR